MRRIVLLSLLLTYIPLQVNAAPSDDALTVLTHYLLKDERLRPATPAPNSLIGQILIAMVVMLEMTH